MICTDGDTIKIFHSSAMPRKGAFRNHHHSAFEVSLILSGSGSYRVRGTDYPIEAHDVFLYHGNEPHCITDIYGDGPMQILNVQFEPRYFWSIKEGAETPDLLSSFFERSRRTENRLPHGTELNEKVKALVLRADAEHSSGGLGSEQMIRSYITQILVLLAREEKSLPKTGIDVEKAQRISDSMDYINENLCGELTLSQIAKQAGLGRTYFCTVFKALNGMSAWDYINIKRIEKAMKMLRTENMSVLETALSCGFNNTANFNKIFKRVTGLTPREYR